MTKESHFDLKKYKWSNWEKKKKKENQNQSNANQQETGIEIIISYKIEFKAKSIDGNDRRKCTIEGITL